MIAEIVQRRVLQKERNGHLDGIRKIRCPHGIREKDINNFFQHQKLDWQQHAPTDHELHERALELMHAHDARVFRNAELTIAGDTSAVRFVSGEGRQKFWIELQPAKVNLQVIVENLLFGFLRLLVCLASLLQIAGCLLSVASVSWSDSDDEELGVKPTAVILFTSLGDVFRAILGFWAAIETINSNSALLSPAFGGGGSLATGQYGVGVWPSGPRRWLFRGLMYAALASGGPPDTLQALGQLLPAEVLRQGLLYSGWILLLASVLSVFLHVLHACFPSLLKSPWTSVSLPSVPQPHPAHTVAVDTDSVTTAVSVADFGSVSTVCTSDDESSGDVGVRSPGGHPASLQCQHRQETTSFRFVRIAIFCLCMTTTLTLILCHLARLVQSCLKPSTLTPVRSALSSLSAMILCGGTLFIHAKHVLLPLLTHRAGVTLTVWKSLLLYIASLSTSWSHDLPIWLTELCGMSKDNVVITMIAFFVTSLSIPSLLLAEQILIYRQKTKENLCLSVSCPQRKIWLEQVKRGVFISAVLLSLIGMFLAVFALSFPVANIKLQYGDALSEAVSNLSSVRRDMDDYYNKMETLFKLDICGGSDVQQLKRGMTDFRQAAALLTVSQLREHCDEVDLRQNDVMKQDPFCQRYNAANRYFRKSMKFNKTLHDDEIKVNSSNKTMNEYLDKVINTCRTKELQALDFRFELTPGAYTVYDDCLIALCIAENAALVAMLVPFVGIVAKFVYLGIVAIETVVKLLIKLSELRAVFIRFKLSLEILRIKLLFYEAEKIVQFSLSNFNLIYLAYPAFLTGSVIMLLGFWYRKGTSLTNHRRASLRVLTPLLVANTFGLSMTFAWHNMVSVLGEVAPMVNMTVTPLSALMVLRVSYILSLLSCLLFLLLAFLRHTRVREPETKTTSTEITPSSSSETVATEIEVDERVAAVTPKKAQNAERRKVTVTQGQTPRLSSWILACLVSLAALCLVSVIIIWKPVYAFDFDFNPDMKRVLKDVDVGLYSSRAAREALSENKFHDCSLVDFVAKAALDEFTQALQGMAFNAFQDILNNIENNVQITALPSLQLIQIPLLLAVFVPFLVITWAAVTTQLRPVWTPSPRFCARLTSTMAWLSLGWLVNGALLLTTVAQGGVVPMFSVQVYIGQGFAFALAADVVLLIAAQELRTGAISPVL